MQLTALPQLDQFAPEPEVPPQPGDDFDAVLRPPDGFCDRKLVIAFQVAGQAETDFDVRPLPLLSSLTRDEMVALNEALAVTDPEAYLYCAAQHLHLGVPVVTVALHVGQSHEAPVLYEERGRDGLVEFMVHCERGAFDACRSAGRKMVKELCKTALAEVVAHVAHLNRGK